MFLEFNKAPGDYVTTTPENDPDLLNEYSVFGSGKVDAKIQVHITYCNNTFTATELAVTKACEVVTVGIN